MTGRILIADKLEESALNGLKAIGSTVDYQPSLTAETLSSAIKGAKILIVRSTKVPKAVFESADALQLVIRAGAGVNTIDLASASKAGIFVTNCPGKNAAAVAELAIGLLLACDRRIPQATADLKSGNWDKKGFSDAAGLKDRTLGILGLGTIGMLVADRAKALEMNVIAWSRSLTPERAADLDIGYCATPLDLAKRSDAVSVHFAMTTETCDIVNAKFIGEMKPKSILINTSRGEICNTAALLQAMNEKKIRVGLDVYVNEPSENGAFNAEITKHPLFCGTPHIGASTAEAQEAVASETVKIATAFIKTGAVLNCVNILETTPAKYRLLVRHQDKPGVLAGVFDLLKRDGINAQRINNTIFQGAASAFATIELDSAVSDASLTAMRSGDGVLGVELIEA
ncbi:MAG: NAD(P)-dependent oxidoreductase [Planctomycetota bacterium]